jgi:hypothetical protein
VGGIVREGDIREFGVPSITNFSNRVKEGSVDNFNGNERTCNYRVGFGD